MYEKMFNFTYNKTNENYNYSVIVDIFHIPCGQKFKSLTAQSVAMLWKNCHAHIFDIESKKW